MTATARPSQREFWQRRYLDHDTPWDKGRPSPPLEDYLQTNQVAGRVLVPGCGAGHDARLLGESAPHAEVVAIDIAPAACELAEKFANPTNVKYLARDFLACDRDFSGAFDWLVEHTLFCAIEPGERAAYARAARHVLRPSGWFLAVFYRQPERDGEDGPPYGCSDSELAELFGDGFELAECWVPRRNYESRLGREEMRLFRRTGGVV